MSRKVARDELFKLVFELCFVKPENTQTYEDFLQDNELDEENLIFINEIYLGVVDKFEELKDLISNNMTGYTLDRLFKVDYAILLIATYELYFHKKTPQNIIANEAVEFAKKYSTEKSYSFINAIISNLIKNLDK